MSSFIAQLGNARSACTADSVGCRARVRLSRIGLSFLLLSSSLAGGCARRAYNEVYVENMAAEIRDLEDQLYEFDGEYRLMEQQLAGLRAENEKLRAGLPSSTSNRSQRQGILSLPNDGLGTENFVPRANTKAQPATPNKISPSPAPSLDVVPSSPSDSSIPKSSTPNAAPNRPTLPNTPNTPSTLPGKSPAGNSPSLAPSTLPPPKPAPGAEQFNPSDLAPPKIDMGEPMPPALPPLGPSASNPVTMQSDNDLELELGQIKLPAQFASMRAGDQAVEGNVPAGQIHPAAQLPSDKRIVEVKFHPTLCRAINSDGQGDDDGLYVVLQPYNAAGEFVALPADLMVLALDLSRDEKQATIGRWTLSTDEVKAKLNPIGSSQGIHLSLSFSGPAPQCDRVLVFAYYTLADGRRVVAEHEVMLNNLHRQNAAWVPRGKSEVRQASHQTPVR